MPPAVRDTPAHRPSARPTGAQTPGLGRTAAAAANSTAAAAANITARSQQKGRRRSAPAAAKGTHNPINPADGSTSPGLRAAAPGPQLQRPVIRQRRRKTPVRHARKRGGGKAREIRGCGNRRNAVCAKNTRAPARWHMHARKRGTGGGRANGTLLAGRAPALHPGPELR